MDYISQYSQETAGSETQYLPEYITDDPFQEFRLILFTPCLFFHACLYDAYVIILTEIGHSDCKGILILLRPNCAGGHLNDRNQEIRTVLAAQGMMRS